jgi:ACS family sodium-dependent inorganic phosphate cotransporter
MLLCFCASLSPVAQSRRALRRSFATAAPHAQRAHARVAAARRLRLPFSPRGARPARAMKPLSVVAAGGAPPPPAGGAAGEDAKGVSAWPLVTAVCALGIFVAYADRSNISTAVLSMAPEFGWSKTFEGVVLSSFFIGYSATQLLGGQLADRFGGKPVLAAGLAAWSAATFITPLAARAGAPQLLLARVALGLGEGVAFPAVHAVIARNVPQRKQSTAVGAVTAASYCGAAMAFLLVPTVIENFGWAASFEGFGAAALLWLPLWLPLRLAPPAPLPARATPLPWRAEAAAAWAELSPLLRTRPVLALCAAQYCGSYGLYGLISWLPTFFSEQYGVALADLPALTVAPYLLQGAVGLAAGGAADALLAAGVPRLAVRRRMQAAGMLLPAMALVAAASPAAAGSPAAGAALVDIGLAASALTLAGVSVNHLDVAPRHAGAVFGAGNTAATLAGLVAVPLTGAVLDATGSWVIVFGLTAAHYVVGAAVFWTWAAAEPLPEDGAIVDRDEATAL